MTPEGKEQKKITDHLKEDGWFTTKLMQTSTNGIPDVLAVREGFTLWIEVKTKTGRLAKIQEHRISELNDYGQDVFVSYGYEDFKTEYELYCKKNEINKLQRKRRNKRIHDDSMPF